MIVSLCERPWSAHHPNEGSVVHRSTSFRAAPHPGRVAYFSASALSHAKAGAQANLFWLEDFLEQPLPFLLLFPGKDCGNDCPVLQPVGDLGGIYRPVRAGRHSAPPGSKMLGPPAQPPN